MPNVKLVILAAGGFGRELLGHIRSIPFSVSGIEVLGFIDPAKKGQTVDGLPVLGDDEWAFSQLPADVQFIPALGNPALRQKLSESYQRKGFRPYTYVHEAGAVFGNAHLGKGVIICKGAVCSTGARLGMGVLLNLNSTVGHDAVLGDFVTLHPGAHINGSAQVGAGSEIGTSAVILPGVKVGKNCVVGAGSVVTKDVGDGEKVVGVPARGMG